MRVSAADVIRQVLTENELEFTESDAGRVQPRICRVSAS